MTPKVQLRAPARAPGFGVRAVASLPRRRTHRASRRATLVRPPTESRQPSRLRLANLRLGQRARPAARSQRLPRPAAPHQRPCRAVRGLSRRPRRTGAFSPTPISVAFDPPRARAFGPDQLAGRQTRHSQSIGRSPDSHRSRASHHWATVEDPLPSRAQGRLDREAGPPLANRVRTRSPHPCTTDSNASLNASASAATSDELESARYHTVRSLGGRHCRANVVFP